MNWIWALFLLAGASQVALGDLSHHKTKRRSLDKTGDFSIETSYLKNGGSRLKGGSDSSSTQISADVDTPFSQDLLERLKTLRDPKNAGAVAGTKKEILEVLKKKLTDPRFSPLTDPSKLRLLFKPDAPKSVLTGKYLVLGDLENGSFIVLNSETGRWWRFNAASTDYMGLSKSGNLLVMGHGWKKGKDDKLIENYSLHVLDAETEQIKVGSPEITFNRSKYEWAAGKTPPLFSKVDHLSKKEEVIFEAEFNGQAASNLYVAKRFFTNGGYTAEQKAGIEDPYEKIGFK